MNEQTNERMNEKVSLIVCKSFFSDTNKGELKCG